MKEETSSVGIDSPGAPTLSYSLSARFARVPRWWVLRHHIEVAFLLSVNRCLISAILPVLTPYIHCTGLPIGTPPQSEQALPPYGLC